MQDSKLDTYSVLKQERLSTIQPNSNPRDTSVPRVSFQTDSIVTKVPKLLMRVNPSSGHKECHAQIAPTIENHTSSLNHIGRKDCRSRTHNLPHGTSIVNFDTRMSHRLLWKRCRRAK